LQFLSSYPSKDFFMVDGLLPGDDPSDALDPEKVGKDLERLRGPRKPPPSDEELKWWALYSSASEKIQELQAQLLHPSTTDEQVVEINEQLRLSRKRLSDLEASRPPE
jgi:hypothetical protein